MMKKISYRVFVNIVVLGFLLFVAKSNALAACHVENSVLPCNTNEASCGNGWCCDTDDECDTTTRHPNAPSGGGTQILKGNCLDTAIGCIPINDEGSFFGFILGWAIGIGGGVAFLLIILSTFQIMTSQGDPKRLQAGQELLYSAIMGLILLVLSVFVLRIIGVDLFGFF